MSELRVTQDHPACRQEQGHVLQSGSTDLCEERCLLPMWHGNRLVRSRSRKTSNKIAPNGASDRAGHVKIAVIIDPDARVLPKLRGPFGDPHGPTLAERRPSRASAARDRRGTIAEIFRGVEREITQARLGQGRGLVVGWRVHRSMDEKGTKVGVEKQDRASWRMVQSWREKERFRHRDINCRISE